MFFRNFLHLVSVIVFLFGSTFACVALPNEGMTRTYHADTTHSYREASDNCCPEDGYKEQIEKKDGIWGLQKQKSCDIAISLGDERVPFDDLPQERGDSPLYQNPDPDRQARGFVETIRLLLYTTSPIEEGFFIIL